MPAPEEGPYIRTVYKPDGSMVKEPIGYGGDLCHKAVAPYAASHGGLGDITPTAEANDPPYLEREVQRGARERV